MKYAMALLVDIHAEFLETLSAFLDTEHGNHNLLAFEDFHAHIKDLLCHAYLI